ncbi:MAG: porin, partial [Elstera sp.]
MKKILLGTSALVLLAGAAAAQQVTTKAPFTVTLGGSIRSDWFFFNDDVNNASSREARIDYRLNFKAEAKAENGLTYGFDARLRNNQNGANQANQDVVGADRKFIYLSGSWGRVEFGDTVSAPTEFEVLSPFIFSTADVTFGSAYGNYALYFPNEGTFHTKVNYYTPTFAGFRAGISYTPEYNSRGRDNARSKFVTGGGNLYKDIIAIGAGYNNKFGDVGLKIGAGYEAGETKETSATVKSTAGDMQVWNIGAQVSYAGFT